MNQVLCYFFLISALVLPSLQAGHQPGILEYPLTMTKFKRGRTLKPRDVETNAIPTEEYFDQDLMMPIISVAIGTKPSNAHPDPVYNLVFTTALSDIILTKSTCEGTEGCETSEYMPNASTTSHVLDVSYNGTYANTTMTGVYVMDTVGILVSKYSDPHPVVDSQPLVLVDPQTIPNFITQRGPNPGIASGLFGAGFESETGMVQGDMTFLPVPQALYQLGLIPEGIFSVDIGTIDGSNGSIIFGGRHIYESMTQYIDVKQSPPCGNHSMWTVGFSSIGIVGSDTDKKIQATAIPQCVLIDPSSSYVYMQDTYYEEVKEYLQERSIISDVIQDIGDQEILLMPSGGGENYSYRMNFVSDPVSNTEVGIDIPLNSLSLPYNDTFHFLRIKKTPQKSQSAWDMPYHFIIGNIFLEQYYIVFDFVNHQISFALR